MLRCLVVCFLVIGIAKWNGIVHAAYLDVEEQELLRALKNVVNEKRNENQVDESMCTLQECLDDKECFTDCCTINNCADVSPDAYEACVEKCSNVFIEKQDDDNCYIECEESEDPEQCYDDCEEDKLLERRSKLAALSERKSNKKARTWWSVRKPKTTPSPPC